MTEVAPNVLIAAGGNLPSHAGDPAQTLAAAVEFLSRAGLQVAAVSRFFNTPCFPAGAGPDYVNAALSGYCDLDQYGVLALLHEAERHFGRERKERWGRRTLDLDLLAFDDTICPDLETYRTWASLPREQQIRRTPDHLILPHPRLQDRAFVLVPLAEIAPDWQHPVLRLSVAQMAENLPEADRRDVVAI